jgi:hypothetical protein
MRRYSRLGDEGTYFVTATTYRLLILTWKKLVEPRVMIGDLTSLLETTCIRKTSAIDRLASHNPQQDGQQSTSPKGVLEIGTIEPRNEHLPLLVEDKECLLASLEFQDI